MNLCLVSATSITYQVPLVMRQMGQHQYFLDIMQYPNIRALYPAVRFYYYIQDKWFLSYLLLSQPIQLFALPLQPAHSVLCQIPSLHWSFISLNLPKHQVVLCGRFGSSRMQLHCRAQNNYKYNVSLHSSQKDIIISQGR